jgi:uncharacterized membrane protein
MIIYSLEDNISIVKDGTYVRDLIMFPDDDLSELDLEDNVTAPSLPDNIKTNSQKTILLITGMVLIIIFALIYCAAFKKCKWKSRIFPKEKENKVAMAKIIEAKTAQGTPVAEESDDFAELAAFISKHKRVTQKDIRKQFPMSEAKISLMLTDLESQGKIRKIKKGRGNVIVWDEK